MHNQRPCNRPVALTGRRAFALVELSAVVLILLVVCVLASLLLPDARRRARLAGSIQNLLQLGNGYAASASDHANRVSSFTWTPGTHTCDNYTFPASVTYNDAAADQAVCIIRTLGGRRDIVAIRAWFPYAYYNHLPLMEYLDERLPSSKLVSPGDAPRLAWQRAGRVAAQDPGDQGVAYFRLACRPAGLSNTEKRWSYSSSYEIQPSFYSPNALTQDPGGPAIPTVAQSTESHRSYTTGSAQIVLGNRRFDEVQHPSHKAFVYETNQRFFGSRELFFLYAEARVPVLFADGSASVRVVGQANRGFQPNIPQSPQNTRVNYFPELSWESPCANGGNAEIVNGQIRWTRQGLLGRDFQGPEVGLPPP
jgi:hypothetical protein